MLGIIVKLVFSAKHVLRDHCLQRPYTCIPTQRPSILSNRSCHQRPPVLRDPIFMPKWRVFQESFYCIVRVLQLFLSLKDHPVSQKNVVSRQVASRDRFNCIIALGLFGRKIVVFQDGLSLVAVVSQDRFHSINL